jgi:hypothetical protein
MSAVLTKEDIINWRRSTERITLEEYAKRLGKAVSEEKKETNDLHDILSKKVDEPVETVEEIKPVQAVKAVETVQKEEFVEPVKAVEKEEVQQKPDIEIKISFKEKLNKREELVFNYFFKNKKRKVFANELAKILNLPNDYVYKYIRNLRKKLEENMLVNAENGGYILNV